MMNKTLLFALAVVFPFYSTQALAWGHEGHEVVGAIADRLIAGKSAEGKVKEILGQETLEQASVWPDCAKGINPASNYAYQPRVHISTCAIYEDEAGQKGMEDYVRRNDVNCTPAEEKETCHKEYHYADIDAIHHSAYKAGLVGTNDHDLVHSVLAAIAILQGKPSPAPFKIKDKQEALRLLAHFVGDLHQPLHVGGVYLEKEGNEANPDAEKYDPATKTNGGNSLIIGTQNLHAMWDNVPTSLKPDRVAPLVELAGKVAPTSGAISLWPEIWANESVAEAKKAFSGVAFGTVGQDNKWPATIEDKKNYNKAMAVTKGKQLVKAGARLAQILEVIWP